MITAMCLNDTIATKPECAKIGASAQSNTYSPDSNTAAIAQKGQSESQVLNIFLETSLCCLSNNAGFHSLEEMLLHLHYKELNSTTSPRLSLLWTHVKLFCSKRYVNARKTKGSKVVS